MEDTVLDAAPAPASNCSKATDCLTDVVVIGGGALGAATAWWLAGAGRPVILIEETTGRQLRLAVRGTAWSAHPGWLADPERPELDEASRAWRELERQTGVDLLTARDAVEHGAVFGPSAAGTWLDPEAAAKRWPGTAFTGPVLLRRDAALQVRADHAVAALTAGAIARGVVVRYRSPVTSVEALDDSHVEVRTAGGRVRARRAIVTTLATPASRGVELHFRPRIDPGDLPLLAHHDPELGLVRAAPCACGHLAIGARSSPRGTLGDLRDQARTWWPGLDAERPEPVGPAAMTTMPAEITVRQRGPIVSASSTALGSIVTIAQGRRLAHQVLAGAPLDAASWRAAR
ncbi:MAG TPA: FAD-dependent oxidoreductase [Pseudonocardia sp.]